MNMHTYIRVYYLHTYIHMYVCMYIHTRNGYNTGISALPDLYV